MKTRITLCILSFWVFLPVGALFSQKLGDTTRLDDRVKKFLDSHAGSWRDMNVPARDGQFLHDLIVKNNYKNALEIGTSTGHSAVWIAWALSKTGGKLTTIEIDEGRYREALANFKKAGLFYWIDARLADAHELVPNLKGRFDFALSDADKEWYTKYFKAVAPKMTIGGCFTAHNITMRTRGIREFVEYIRSLPNFETTIEQRVTTGISVSYKKAEQ